MSTPNWGRGRTVLSRNVTSTFFFMECDILSLCFIMSRHYNRSAEDSRHAGAKHRQWYGPSMARRNQFLAQDCRKVQTMVILYCTRIRLTRAQWKWPPMHASNLPAEQKCRKKLVWGGWGRPGRLTLVYSMYTYSFRIAWSIVTLRHNESAETMSHYLLKLDAINVRTNCHSII